MSYASEVAADSPLGWWRSAEALGATTAADASGNGNTGTYAGVTLGQPSLLNSDPANAAADYDGVDDGLTVPDSASLATPTTAVAATAWIKPNNVTTRQGVISRYGTNGNNRIWMVDVENGAINFFLGLADGSDFQVTRSTAVLTAGTVYHVACAWGSAVDSARMRIYLNGVEAAYATQNSPTSSLPAAASSTPVRVGVTYTARHFDGIIDEPAVFAGLSAARVAAHYAAGIADPELGRLVDRWDGTQLVRAQLERWDGSVLQPAIIE